MARVDVAQALDVKMPSVGCGSLIIGERFGGTGKVQHIELTKKAKSGQGCL